MLCTSNEENRTLARQPSDCESAQDAKITCEFERFGVELIAQLPSGRLYGVRVKDAEAISCALSLSL
eukprot:Skav206856  [mRNA]  locus=scaffold1667:188928:189328:- [translate_table: standard]